MAYPAVLMAREATYLQSDGAMNWFDMEEAGVSLRFEGGFLMKFLTCATLCLVAASLTATPSHASETVAYTYDAKGRLVKVERSGSANNGVKTEYEHDKADNRKRAKTTGVS